MKVAIVGLGVAGTSTLMELVKKGNWGVEHQIDVYDPRERSGAGQAYLEDDDVVIINTYPGSLSIREGQSDDFTHWLEAKYPGEDFTHAYVSRNEYGKYLNSVAEEYLATDGVEYHQVAVEDLRIVDAEGVHYLNSDQGRQYYQLKTNGKWTENYAAVFLAIGHPPYQDAYNLRGIDDYIHNPFPVKEKLSRFKKHQRIAVIGTGLTSLDITRYLTKTYGSFDHTVLFFNRKNGYSTVNLKALTDPVQHTLTAEWRADQLEKHNGIIPFEKIKKQILKDMDRLDINIQRLYEKYGKGTLNQIKMAIESQDLELSRLENYISAGLADMGDLLNMMSASDHAYFIENYYDIVNHFYAQMPEPSLQLVLNLVEEGKIRIINGMIAVDVQEDGHFVVHAEGGTYEVDVLINATGYDQNLISASQQDPFIKNLYERRILTSGDQKRVQVSWPLTQPISILYGVLDHVHLLGSWIQDTQYPLNSAGLNMKQGRRVANHFLDNVEW